MKLRSFFLVNLSILITLVSSGDKTAHALIGAETVSDVTSEESNLAYSNPGTSGEIGAGSATSSGIMAPSDRTMLYHTNPNTLYKVDYNQRLSIEDIKAMSQAKIRDGVIIDKINATNSHYALTGDQIRNLRESGVSRRVIDAIQKNPQNTNYRRNDYQQQNQQQRYNQPYQRNDSYQRGNTWQQNFPRNSGSSYRRTSPGPYYQRGGTGS